MPTTFPGLLWRWNRRRRKCDDAATTFEEERRFAAWANLFREDKRWNCGHRRSKAWRQSEKKRNHFEKNDISTYSIYFNKSKEIYFPHLSKKSLVPNITHIFKLALNQKYQRQMKICNNLNVCVQKDRVKTRSVFSWTRFNIFHISIPSS